MAESSGILLLDAENNSESGLTITEEGGNTFSINADSALHGSLGYKFAFDGNAGNNLCNFYKGFTAAADIYTRCYFRFPSAFSAAASGNVLIGAMLNYNTGGGYCCYVRGYYNVATGTIALDRFYYYDNAGAHFVALTATTITRDTAHYIELHYKSGAGDGAVELWYDGNSIASVTSLTNNTYQAAYIQPGNTQALVPSNGSYISIDDVKVDSLYIGAYADVSAYDGILKRWNGSSWVKAKLENYNGAAFVSKPLKFYDGVSWKTVDTTGV
jgi:hypothetical protein